MRLGEFSPMVMLEHVAELSGIDAAEDEAHKQRLRRCSMRAHTVRLLLLSTADGLVDLLRRAAPGRVAALWLTVGPCSARVRRLVVLQRPEQCRDARCG